MNRFFDHQGQLALSALMLMIAVGLFMSGCELANAGTTPEKAKYFGDEFAPAHMALKDKPIEDQPPTF